jgi:DNA-binding PadR family transcriptional regulator
VNTTFAVLAALALAPAHPYALLDHLRAMGAPVSRSALYRTVDALVAGGLAEATLEQGETGHLRRRLELTAAGRERLAGEALAALRQAPLESPTFALALAAAEATGVGGVAGELRERLAAAARRLTALERELRAGDSGRWPAARQEREAAHLRADIGWLQAQLRRAG